MKKKLKKAKSNDVIDLSSLLVEITDLDRNLSIKNMFGICPLELLHFIVKEGKTKL